MGLRPKKWTIRKLFKFEAAHRLVSSWSQQCQKIHGHSYKLELFLSAEELDENGMVVDFGKLKELFSKKLEQFDHKCILSEQDPLSIIYDGEMSSSSMLEDSCFDLGVLVVPFNPTAENMACFFYEQVEQIFYKNEDLRHIKVEAVRIHETETGWAEYSRKY